MLMEVLLPGNSILANSNIRRSTVIIKIFNTPINLYYIGGAHNTRERTPATLVVEKLGHVRGIHEKRCQQHWL